MLKNCSCFFIIVLLLGTVCFIEGRPQSKRVAQNRSKLLNTNNTSVTLIKKIIGNNVSRDENNKTKTRILFREEFVGEFNDQDIIFPDTYQVIFENIPRIDSTPKCASGNTFCEDFDPYPYRQVKDVLKRKHIHNYLFGKDELPDEDYSITNRNGDIETFVCASIRQTVFPRIGKNKNNKWKFIINQGETDGYVQGVTIEVCRNEGSACDLIGHTHNGYITSCKQKYILRRLMSLSDNGDPIPDTFQLPSACCCSYRKDLSFLSRFGETNARISSREKTREI